MTQKIHLVSMVYIGIFCGVGGLLVLLVVGIIFFARGAKKRGSDCQDCIVQLVDFESD